MKLVLDKRISCFKSDPSSSYPLLLWSVAAQSKGTKLRWWPSNRCHKEGLYVLAYIYGWAETGVMGILLRIITLIYLKKMHLLLSITLMAKGLVCVLILKRTKLRRWPSFKRVAYEGLIWAKTGVMRILPRGLTLVYMDPTILHPQNWNVPSLVASDQQNRCVFGKRR